MQDFIEGQNMHIEDVEKDTEGKWNRGAKIQDSLSVTFMFPGESSGWAKMFPSSSSQGQAKLLLPPKLLRMADNYWPGLQCTFILEWTASLQTSQEHLHACLFSFLFFP